MSRRCKPGQRARVLSSSNHGAIVLVVRYYFGESVSGGTWPEALFPWVVTSLGAPLGWVSLHNPLERGRAMTIVVDDCNLEPLGDADDDLTQIAEKEKPMGLKSRSAHAVNKEALA